MPTTGQQMEILMPLAVRVSGETYAQDTCEEGAKHWGRGNLPVVFIRMTKRTSLPAGLDALVEKAVQESQQEGFFDERINLAYGQHELLIPKLKGESPYTVKISDLLQLPTTNFYVSLTEQEPKDTFNRDVGVEFARNGEGWTYAQGVFGGGFGEQESLHSRTSIRKVFEESAKKKKAEFLVLNYLAQNSNAFCGYGDEDGTYSLGHVKKRQAELSRQELISMIRRKHKIRLRKNSSLDGLDLTILEAIKSLGLRNISEKNFPTIVRYIVKQKYLCQHQFDELKKEPDTRGLGFNNTFFRTLNALKGEGFLREQRSFTVK